MAEEPEVYQDPMDEPIAEGAEPEDSPASTEPADDTPAETPEAKKTKGVQDRIDELVRQREEARRQAEAWQQVAMKSQPVQEERKPVAYPDLVEPQSEDFDTYDQYVDARADYRAEVKLRQYLDSQRNQHMVARKSSWAAAAAQKYDDFSSVFHPNLPITEAMGEVILESAIGHDIAYYLGKNPSEAQRISGLSPVKQAYEIAKIENKLSGPPQKVNTNAPNPTSPVGGKELPSKRLEDMADDEYIATRERKLGYRK